MQEFIHENWYSAIYKEGFSIIFQVLAEDDSLMFKRKDGILVDELPCGYLHIVPHGTCEPHERISFE